MCLGTGVEKEWEKSGKKSGTNFYVQYTQLYSLPQDEDDNGNGTCVCACACEKSGDTTTYRQRMKMTRDTRAMPRKASDAWASLKT